MTPEAQRLLEADLATALAALNSAKAEAANLREHNEALRRELAAHEAHVANLRRQLFAHGAALEITDLQEIIRVQDIELRGLRKLIHPRGHSIILANQRRGG